MANIGYVLRRLRAERDWTQKQLSQASGLSQTDIARIENGVTKRPSAKTVGRLSRAFGIEIEELEGYSRESRQTEAVPAGNQSSGGPAMVLDAVEDSSILFAAGHSGRFRRLFEIDYLQL